MEGEEEGITGWVGVLVAADEVTGAGGGTCFRGEVCSPGRMTGGGDKGTTKTDGFCLPLERSEGDLSPAGGSPGEEAPGEDNQDAIENGEGGTDLTDVVEQGSG